MTLLTIREASHFIGRTSATIRRYIRSGRLKAEKEPGKFGEEYKISSDDLLALGLSPAGADLPVRAEGDAPVAASPACADHLETMIPVSVFNELLMKHEQLLVQYGMIRAGGQKLLEYKADAEVKEVELDHIRGRFRQLRDRAAKEIRFLRMHLREAEIEIEDRNIEITLLQEKVKRLEMAAAGAASLEGFQEKVMEIRDQERVIARIEATEPESSTSYAPPRSWIQEHTRGEQGEDH
jgi:Helix-turn-helix domain